MSGADDVEELRQQLDEAAQLAEDMALRVQQKDDIIEELRSRVEDLEDKVASDRPSSQDYQEEAQELIARLEDELEKSRDRGKDHESRAQHMEMELEAIRLEKLQQERELNVAQEKLEDLEASARAAKQRTEQADESRGKLGAREKSHKKTLIKALAENEEMRQELTELRKELVDVVQAYKAMEDDASERQAQVELAQQELKDAENEIQELKRVIKENDKELALAQDEIAAAGELESEVNLRVDEKVKEWAAKIHDLEDQVRREQTRCESLEKICDNLKTAQGVKDVEVQLHAEQERNTQITRLVEDLKEGLSRAQEETIQVGNELLHMKLEHQTIIDVALEQERKEIETLRHRLRVKDDRVSEEHARYEELLNDKARVESELQDREYWMAEYERGHGLTEAVAFQKKLKGDIHRRDKEISRLNQLISERIAGLEKMTEICRRLKQDAGLPQDFAYDDIELSDGIKGEVERLSGLILEYEAQNSQLEDERLRLLKALRVSAQNMSEQGFKSMGLTAEQMVMVHEFVDKLREGSMELPLNDRSRELQVQVRKLKDDLRDAHRDLALAEARGGPLILSANGDNDPSSLSAQQLYEHQLEMQREIQGSSLGGNSALFNGSLRPGTAPAVSASAAAASVDLTALYAKQENLVRNLGKSIQEKLSAIARDAAQVAPPTAQPQQDPRISDMLAVLEHKLQGGGALDNTQVKEMQTQMQELMMQNNALRERLASAAADAAANVDRSGGMSGNRNNFRPQSHGDGGTTSSLHALGIVAMSGPATHAGKELNRQVIDALHLPPQEWTEQFTLLNAQLMECMEGLTQRTKTIHTLEKSLKRYKAEMKDVVDRESLLYAEFAGRKEQWTRQLGVIARDRDDARAERDALRAKAQRLDTVCAVLEGGQDNARDHVRELTRKLVVYEVNQVVMARKYNLMSEEETSLRDTKQRLEQEMHEMQAALRARVLYLEQHKANHKSELTRLQQRVNDLVPKQAHEAVVEELGRARSELRRVLVRETERLSLEAKCNALESQKRELDLELKYARADVDDATRRAAAAQEHAEWLKRRVAELGNPVSGGVHVDRHAVSGGDACEPEDGGGDADARARVRQALLFKEQQQGEEQHGGGKRNVDKLVQEMARFKGQAMEKEILLASALKRGEILEADRVVLMERINSAEEQCMALSHALEVEGTRVQELSMELQRATDDFTNGGCTSKERNVMDVRMAELESMCENLSRDVQRSNEMADIATSQVQAIEAIHKAAQDESSALRDQLRRAHARTDDDAIIGKLQHGLTTTKANYQLFVRKFQMQTIAFKKKDLKLRESEMLLDEKDEALRKLRESSRAQTLSLQTALDQMRGQLTHGADTVTLVRIQRIHKDVSGLALRLKDADANAQASTRIRQNSQMEVDQLRTELEQMKEELNTTRLALTATGDDSRIVLLNKLSAMSDLLKTNKLAMLKNERLVTLLRAEKEYVDKLQHESEGHIARLEAALAEAEAHQRVEHTLPMHVEPEHQHDQHHKSVSSRARGENDEAMNVAVEGAAAQDKHAALLEELNARNKEVVELRSTVSDLQAQLRLADRIKSDMRVKHSRANDKIRFLRKNLRSEGIQVDDDDDDNDDGDENEENQSLLMSGDEKRTNDENDILEGAENRNDGNSRSPRGGEKGKNGNRNSRQTNDDKRNKYYEEQSRRTKLAAQRTIASLKEIVDRKNKALEENKRKVGRMQVQAMAERERDQAEIERLTERLYDENKTAISKLRHAFEDISTSVNPNNGDGDNAGGGSAEGVRHPHHGGDEKLIRDLISRTEESDAIVAAKDRRIHALELREAEGRKVIVICEQRLEQAESLSEAYAEKLRRALLESESRTGDRHVKQLKAQLVAKDKKIAGLRTGVVVLKNEFVRAEEEFEQVRTKLERAAGGAVGGGGSAGGGTDSDIIMAVDGLKKQVVTLQKRVERARGELDKTKQNEKSAKQLVKELRRELGEAVNGTQSKSEQLSDSLIGMRKYQKQVDELLRENERLRDTITRGLAPREAAAASTRRSSMSSSGGGDGVSNKRSRLAAIDAANVAAMRAARDTLQQRVRVLEAQNAALRSAAKAGASSSSATATAATPPPRPPSVSRLESGGGASKLISAGEGGRMGSTGVVERRLKRQVAKLSAQNTDLGRQVERLGAEAGKLRTAAARRLHQSSNNGGASVLGSSQVMFGSGSVGGSPVRRDAGIGGNSQRNQQQRQQLPDLVLVEEHMRVRDELHSVRESLRVTEAAKERAERQLRDDEGSALPMYHRGSSYGRGGGGGSIEDELMASNHAVTDLRFELAQQARELSDLRLRTRELQAYRDITAGIVSTGGGTSGNVDSVSSPSSRSRHGGGNMNTNITTRNADMARVVESMKKVIERLKGENERLSSSARQSDKWRKQSQDLTRTREHVKEVEKEVERLSGRVELGDQARTTLVRTERALQSARRQIRELRASSAAAGSSSVSDGGEGNALDVQARGNGSIDEERMEVFALEGRVRDLEGQVRSESEEKEEMHFQLNEKTELLEEAVSRLETLRAQNNEFRNENARLVQELSAFDLDFFEEIEDLKYKYHQVTLENEELRASVAH